jgi:glycosyltransferase involved in cell wall biosynthesis
MLDGQLLSDKMFSMSKATIVFVDDLSPYSKNLYSKIITKSKSRFVFYAPKTTFGKLSSNGKVQNMKHVWSSHLYPFQIAHEIAKDKPDIVHVQFELNTFGSHYTALLIFPLLLLLRGLRTKVVVTVHTVIPRNCFTRQFTDFIIPPTFRTWHIPVLFYEIGLSTMYSFIGRFSEKLIVHTATQKKHLVHDYHIRGSRIFVIPQGVDYATPLVDGEKVQFWRKKTGNKQIILYFGTITPIKGLDWLIQSFSLLQRTYSNCVLLIVGGLNYYYTDYYNNIKSLVHTLNLGDKVFFTGWLDAADLDSVFSLADVVVFSHVFPHSPSGTVAMVKKHQKKLIVSNFEILKEQLIGYERANFVPARDRESLTEAMRSALTEPSSDLGIGGDISHKDSWDCVALKTLLLYDGLWNSPKKISDIQVASYSCER